MVEVEAHCLGIKERKRAELWRIEKAHDNPFARVSIYSSNEETKILVLNHFFLVFSPKDRFPIGAVLGPPFSKGGTHFPICAG